MSIFLLVQCGNIREIHKLFYFPYLGLTELIVQNIGFTLLAADKAHCVALSVEVQLRIEQPVQILLRGQSVSIVEFKKYHIPCRHFVADCYFWRGHHYGIGCRRLHLGFDVLAQLSLIFESHVRGVGVYGGANCCGRAQQDGQSLQPLRLFQLHGLRINQLPSHKQIRQAHPKITDIGTYTNRDWMADTWTTADNLQQFINMLDIMIQLPIFLLSFLGSI